MHNIQLSNSLLDNCHEGILFYQYYPGIAQTASAQLETCIVNCNFTIRRTLSAQLVNEHTNIASIAPDALLKSLSFSHFVELMKINESIKRCFYEHQI